MIEKLQWDSVFFGYPVGQIQIEKGDGSGISDVIKDAVDFRLVYVISPQPINTPIIGLKLVDIKTRFSKQINISKQINNEESYSFQNIHEYPGGADDQLKRLALQGGVFSRFKVDPNFVNKEFERLYLKWITESIQKTIADKVFIYSEEEGNCNGFITLKFKDKFSEIGLIAVEERSRQKGIAKSLLAFVDNSTIKAGLNKIEVVTQFENVPAMQLYEKSGYEIISKKYIYHLWK